MDARFIACGRPQAIRSLSTGKKNIRPRLHCKLLESDPICISICRGSIYFACLFYFFCIDSVNLRSRAVWVLCASTTRTIRTIFLTKKTSVDCGKIKILEHLSNQSFPKHVKKSSKMDFYDRNKKLAGWFRNVPDRLWGRGSAGVLRVAAKWIPINRTIFWNNGSISLANSHTFVVSRRAAKG